MNGRSLDLLKGTLEVLLLKAVSARPLHGYGISRWLRERTDETFRVEEGALYPALRRLEAKGFLEGNWGTTETGREAKFYELTLDGRAEMRRSVSTWYRYADAMALVLGPIPR
jgi:PadR family transcriptional regulator PadR